VIFEKKLPRTVVKKLTSDGEYFIKIDVSNFEKKEFTFFAKIP